ncbi:MAG: cation transporter [Demequinaceae bacterium]|nr:cation transporter [Demequinaceae bacterium]
MTASPEARVDTLTRKGLSLTRFTVGYNLIEGAISIAVGITAGLVSVVGFGFDAGIESLSAVLVSIRLAARLRHGHIDETKEKRALKVVATTFFILAVYVTYEGIASIVRGDTPETPLLGIGILTLSLIVMPVLAARKRAVGLALRDKLILADAAETRVCVYLSASTLVGVGLFALTGLAWLDPVAGFVIAVFAVREGFEAWDGKLEED